MEKTLFIITVAVVTAMNYEELMRPTSDKVKEYTVSVEAETVEKAELIAGKIIADDPIKFDKETQYIKIVDAKLASGARPIYKDDNIDYRQLQRALRRYHMWPYATRTVELAIDNCVYKGMTPDAAAKWIYEHPEGITTSPNRDAQGDELTALQMMYTELKRKEGVRFEKMQNPEQKSASESAEKKEPLYPNAGLERYIQQNHEVTKKMADLSRPEQVVTVENESAVKEGHNMPLRKMLEKVGLDKEAHVVYRNVKIDINLVKEEYEPIDNIDGIMLYTYNVSLNGIIIDPIYVYDCDDIVGELADKILIKGNDIFQAVKEDKVWENYEEEENMEIKTLYKDVDRTDRKAVRKISNQVLSMVIDKKTNEEKHLFSKVFNILYDSGAYMDIAEENDKITVFFGDSGIVIPVKSAIKFAREMYLEVQDPEWVSIRNAQAIRARLAELFKQNKVSENTAENKKEEGNMNKMIVTGIGSREIDETGKARVTEIAKMMDAKGFILRSGGADGADSIFEANMNNKEVYLPWKGFNGNLSALYQLKPECFSIARSVHPAWNKLSSGAQKLHARNVYQVLGYDLNMPSSICVCWTKDGIKTEAESSIATGGSRTAIVLADRNHIPVFNLKLDADYEELKRILASDTIPFKEAVVKQETTKTQQSETVENKPAVNNAAENAIEKEEDKMNDVQGRETQVVNPFDEMVSPGREPDRTVDLKVFAMYNGKKGYVNRTTTFWTKEPEFYVGNVFKNGVKVGSWTWNLEFKYPQYKPVAGSLGGDGATAFNYAYPSDMKKMETNEERVNRTNVNGYLVAITVALAKVGIKTKYQPKNSNYGASVMDSSGPAPRTVTGRTHKKPEEPVIVNTGIDENDLAFYE